MWQEVSNITLETHPDRQAVLEAERIAIINEHPRYNVTHNYAGQILESAVQLDRVLPLQVGDWAVLGLANGDCPVGAVVAVDETWIAVKLKNFLYGHISNQVRIIRWADVQQISAAYPEDAENEDNAMVMQDDHLGTFQSKWQHSDNPVPTRMSL